MSIKVIRIYQLDGIVNAGLELKGGFFEVEVPAGPVAGGYMNKRLGVEQLAELLGASPSTDGLSAEQVGAIVEDLLVQGTGITITRTTDGKLEIASSVSAGAVGALPPEAPTAGVVDDIGDTFSFLPNAAYPSFAQYKVNGLPGVTGAVVLDNTNSYVQGPRIYVKVVGAVAKGGLAVYVAGSGNVPDGAVLTNGEAFTGANVPPVPTPGAALTAALAISVASIVAGNALTFEVTAGGGTAPYSYAVKATNNATGAVTILGSSATGSFTPQAGVTTYNIDATVTDSAGKVAQAVTRTVTVTAAQSVNQLPIASAGSDLAITAPTSSVALMATASDPDPGDNLTYLWRPITGPNTPQGLPATTLNVVVSGLIVGTYQFGFQATDQKGGKSQEDFVVVNVNAAPVGTSGRRPLLAYGQSNMEGHERGTSLTNNQQLAEKNLTRQFANTRIQNRATGKLEALKFGVNQYGGAPMDGVSADTSFGFELGLADAVERNRPTDQLDIVKYGLGGRTVGELSKNAGNGYYQDFVAAALALKATYAAAGIAWKPSFLYNQGESGGANSGWPAAVKQLFDDLTTDGALAANSQIMVVIPQGSVEGNVSAMRANALSLVNLDSRVEYIDAAQYNLVDAYHYDAFSYWWHGSYDVYNAVYGLPRNKPSYISASQFYTTTSADYAAKCSAGTAQSVTRIRQAVSFTSKSEAVSLSLAAATTDAKNAIVCNTNSGGGAPVTRSFSGPNSFVRMPEMTGVRTLVMYWAGGAVTPQILNAILLDSRRAAGESPFAYLDNSEGTFDITEVWAAGKMVTPQAGNGLAAIHTGNLQKLVIEFSDAIVGAAVALNLFRRGFPFGQEYYGVGGDVGAIRLYSRKLTLAEKQDAAFSMPTDSVLAAYRAEDITTTSTTWPDSSGNGRNATMAFGASQSGPSPSPNPGPGTSQLVKNSEFDSPAVSDLAAGWVAQGSQVAIVNGHATFTNAYGAGAGELLQTVSGMVVGRQYTLAFNVSGLSSGNIVVQSGNGSNGQYHPALGDGGTDTSGVKTKVFTANNTTDTFYLRGINGANGTVEYLTIAG